MTRRYMKFLQQNILIQLKTDKSSLLKRRLYEYIRGNIKRSMGRNT